MKKKLYLELETNFRKQIWRADENHSRNTSFRERETREGGIYLSALLSRRVSLEFRTHSSLDRWSNSDTRV